MDKLINDNLRISITDACNLDCIYCSNEGQPHSIRNNARFLSLDFVRALCARIKNDQLFVQRVNITGGEPMLHPQLNDIVQEFAKITKNVALNSNGILLTEKNIQNLIGNGVNTFKIGLDNIVGDETKPCFTKRKGLVEKVKNNILLCKEKLNDTSVDVVLSNANISSIDKMVEFIIKNKLTNSIFIELLPYDFWGNGEIPLNGISFGKLYSILQEKSKTINHDYSTKRGLHKLVVNGDINLAYAEDFCKKKLCKNLCTRIDAGGNFLPCVKKNKLIPIDLSKALRPQLVNYQGELCHQN
ncbi:MAG: radical SAM protein [Clostridia bacterium]|nr:radical SAM protein [Clostridia bacterium]